MGKAPSRAVAQDDLDRKLAEQAFAGSLAILAILVAAIGLISSEQERVQGVDYLYERFQWLQRGCAGVSIISAVLALCALERMRGKAVPMWTIEWLARLLIVGIATITVTFWLI